MQFVQMVTYLSLNKTKISIHMKIVYIYMRVTSSYVLKFFHFQRNFLIIEHKNIHSKTVNKSISILILLVSTEFHTFIPT